MKIGVFGDSFADKDAENIWWRFLESHHGHVVTSFGEGGSSILFSAELVNKNAQNFDFVIWCLTGVGRFSFKNENKENCHFVTHLVDHRPVFDNTTEEMSPRFLAYQNYLKYMFDFDTEVLVAKALANYMLTQHQNLMIVPCFLWPLESAFNLFTVSEKEAQSYFPDKQLMKIYRDYQDLRPGHISTENQMILAKLFDQKLESGIFQSSYDMFVAPTEPISDAFTKL